MDQPTESPPKPYEMPGAAAASANTPAIPGAQAQDLVGGSQTFGLANGAGIGGFGGMGTGYGCGTGYGSTFGGYNSYGGGGLYGGLGSGLGYGGGYGSSFGGMGGYGSSMYGGMGYGGGMGMNGFQQPGQQGGSRLGEMAYWMMVIQSCLTFMGTLHQLLSASYQATCQSIGAFLDLSRCMDQLKKVPGQLKIEGKPQNLPGMKPPGERKDLPWYLWMAIVLLMWRLTQKMVKRVLRLVAPPFADSAPAVMP